MLLIGFSLILLLLDIENRGENLVNITSEYNENGRPQDEISKVGMTGYTYIPHLHFQVYVYTGYNIWTDFETIEIKDFKNML